MNTLFPFFFLLLAPYLLFAQDQEQRHYRATRLTVPPPEIDGNLDDAAWQTGAWSGDFTQFEPHNGRPSTEQTEFMILYDEDNIYVAIRAFDSAPDSIVARLARRDQSDGDHVAIAFDSYHDLRTAFVFGVTAGGVKFDHIMSNDGQNEDWSWDPNWWVRTSIDENGWVAEMRIPLSQLRFEQGGAGLWGLQLARQIYRHGEMSLWSHIPRDAPGRVRRFGKMAGFNGVKPRTIFDVTPYVLTSAARYPGVEGNPFMSGSDNHYSVGLDAKLGLNNYLTLDMSINPDFGQVEADPSEVNLTAFESFFQEKRPFFIEGRNISSFGLGLGNGDMGNDNLFYSRRIGRRPRGSLQLEPGAVADVPGYTRILGAAKLTGKTPSGLSLAIIEAVTAEERVGIDLFGDRTYETVEPLTNFFVGRLQKDLPDGKTIIGGMFTSVHRNTGEELTGQMHRAAYSGGVDFYRYFKDRTWMFNLNTAISHVEGSPESIVRTQRAPARYFQRPGNSHVKVDSTLTSLTGSGGRLQLVKTGGGHWNFFSIITWKSPMFEVNDLGYMREADQVFQVTGLNYREWEPKGLYRSYHIGVNQFNIWNFGGSHLMSGFNLNGGMQYRNHWSSNAGLAYNYRVVSVTALRGGPAFRMPNRTSLWFSTSSDNRKNFVVGMNANLGRYGEGSMESVRVGSSFTYRPMDKVNVALSPSYSKSTYGLQYIGQRSYHGQPRYLLGTIRQEVISFSFRLNYTLLPDLSIQYWGQPFMAAGNYSEFKYVTDPMGSNYADRFARYGPDQILLADGFYHVDENLDGGVDYHFRKPDFRFREFLSNLVIRWEYSPGSSLYLVWGQNRMGAEGNGSLDYFRDLDELFSEKPHNTFLLKFSYRLGLR